MLRHVALECRHPQGVAEGEADPDREAHDREPDQGEGDSEGREQQPGRDDAQLGGHERPREPEPQGKHAAGDGAERLDRQDRAPRAGPAKLLLRNQRPEHQERRKVGELEGASKPSEQRTRGR